MMLAAETVLATRLCADSNPGSRSDATAGAGAGWVWAGARVIGVRHAALGGVCEDAIAAAAHENGAKWRLNLALADGVSGGARGEVAAAALVRHCVDYAGETVDDAVRWMDEGAESAVRAALIAHTPQPGAATFACAWLDSEGRGMISRVGDCRLYAFEPDEGAWGIRLQQLLPDQTMSYLGYVPPNHPRAGNPAHMVGNGNMGQLEWRNLSVPPEGGLIMCSDGLHRFVSDNMLRKSLAAALAKTRSECCPPQNPWEQVCRSLIEVAQIQGSDDDIALLIAVRY